MKARDAFAIAAIICLLFLNGAYLVRVARRWHGLRLECGRVKISRLSDETRRRLESLNDDVFCTYYVSDRSRMPSNMRRVEQSVTDLLESLRDAAKGRLEYQIVDPDTDTDLSRFAARKGVAPFRARSVERDSCSERTVWSTLTVSYGPRPETAINGIGPEHLPRLQATVAEYLNQMERPRRAVIALAAPGDTQDLVGGISEYYDRASRLGNESQKAQVVRVDLAAGGVGSVAIPSEADVLFWVDPVEVGPSLLRELDQFLEKGRSILIAGSEHVPQFSEVGGKPALSVRRSGYPAETLLAHFGLRPVQGLALDKSSDQLLIKENKVDARFLLRCNGYNQNFRGLKNEPSGNFLFLVPTPMALDGDMLLEKGWTPQVLATTSEETWIAPLPGEPVPFADLTLGKGEPVSKQPLMVLLRPADPWKGSVILCAASTPFHDGFFKREGVAHRRLLQSLLENLVPLERLVINRASIVRPQPLPELSSGARIFWRGACVFLFPVLLTGLALFRGALPRRAEPEVKKTGDLARLLLRWSAGLAAVFFGVWCSRLIGLRVDLTRGRLNELAPQTRRIAAGAHGEDAAKAELIFSPPDRLPPALRPLVRRVPGLFRELGRAGAEISVTSLHPEDLDAEGRLKLASAGIEPIKMTTRDEELTTVRTVYSAIRLSSRGRSEVIRFPHPASFENLEFRLAFALWRLRTGKHPEIAFAADTPRLSAAEAYEYYQTQGLFAPMGTDVYSLSRDFLESCGFRVTHINTREPVFPEKPDAFLWLQPRRPVERLLTLALRYLHEGGHVLLAAQHFNIQSRQYRGKDFKMVYWPQPQSPDVERYYFPEIGIDLVREVLFDELKTHITTDTQVNRSAIRPEFDKQASALPFLVRAAAANFSKDSPITGGVGDQAFIWGSFLRWDREKLKEWGIRATPLITTSEKAWSFKWKGYWIPDELLSGPDPKDEGKSGWVGKQALVALFEGTFPFKEIKREDAFPGAGPQDAAEKPPPPPPALEKGGKEGKLLFFGSSEMFKNHRLFDSEFRADHLLLNTVSALALNEDLAAIASRRPVPHGFDYVEPSTMLSWRIFVLTSSPALTILLGLFWWTSRARSSILSKKG
jgi:hypothetical protein